MLQSRPRLESQPSTASLNDAVPALAPQPVLHRMCNRQFELRVRTEPDRNSVILGALAFGETVVVLEERGTWCRVQGKPTWTFPPGTPLPPYGWALKSVETNGAVQQMLEPVIEVQPASPFLTATSPPPTPTTAPINPFQTAPTPSPSPNPFGNPVPPKPASIQAAVTQPAAPAQPGSRRPQLWSTR